jgi:hypothetical protein
MAMRATANLAIKQWEEGPFHEHEGGPNLVRASVTQTYTGEIEGEGTLIYLMVYKEDGVVPSMALERVVGRIGERSGSFVLRHIGSYADNVAQSTCEVVPGAGTGDLRGLTGAGSLHWPHEQPGTLTLDYDFA